MSKQPAADVPSEEQDQSIAALQMFRRRATFRHGHPVEMTGTLFKEGKTFKMKKKLICKLHDAALTLYAKEETAPLKVITVVKCVPGTRKYELCVMDNAHHTTSFFTEAEEGYIAWLQALRKASDRNIDQFYQLGPILGKGSYGTVRYGHAVSGGETVAIKVMDKSRFSAKEVRLYKRELLIMQHVSHPKIVQTHDLFETSDKLYIVLEYMPRGMLYDVINTMGNFSEKKAAEVMRGVFEALVYLHSHQIIHRDLKPENILCKNKDYPLDVKIADFGLAKFIELVDGEHTLGSAVGTPFYCAPEVARRQPYNHTCDMWSCGVILYNLLSGRQPFAGTGKREVLNKVIQGKFDFPKEDWVLISDEAKSLIRALLQKDPSKRLNARSALHHPWFSCAALLDQALPREKTMLDVKGNRMRRFRGAVRALIAAQWFMDLTEDYDVMQDLSSTKPTAFSARLDVSALQGATRKVQRTLSGSNLKEIAQQVGSGPSSPRRGANAVQSSARLV